MLQKALKMALTFTALALAGTAIYATFEFGRRAIDWLFALNSSIAVAIIAAVVTVLVSVFTVVVGKVIESRTLLKKEHREKKIPVYEDLIKFTMRVLMGSKMEKPLSEQEMFEFIAGFNQRFMVWGSDEVVAAWAKWRRVANDDEATKADPMKLMFLYEDLVFAIRTDLGHKNKGLARGDILVLFVNDIDQHLPKRSN